jgi:hypothetical protein
LELQGNASGLYSIHVFIVPPRIEAMTKFLSGELLQGRRKPTWCHVQRLDQGIEVTGGSLIWTQCEKRGKRNETHWRGQLFLWKISLESDSDVGKLLFVHLRHRRLSCSSSIRHCGVKHNYKDNLREAAGPVAALMTGLATGNLSPIGGGAGGGGGPDMVVAFFWQFHRLTIKINDCAPFYVLCLTCPDQNQIFPSSGDAQSSKKHNTAPEGY